MLASCLVRVFPTLECGAELREVWAFPIAGIIRLTPCIALRKNNLLEKFSALQRKLENIRLPKRRNFLHLLVRTSSTQGWTSKYNFLKFHEEQIIVRVLLLTRHSLIHGDLNARNQTNAF